MESPISQKQYSILLDDEVISEESLTLKEMIAPMQIKKRNMVSLFPRKCTFSTSILDETISTKTDVSICTFSSDLSVSNDVFRFYTLELCFLVYVFQLHLQNSI